MPEGKRQPRLSQVLGVLPSQLLPTRMPMRAVVLTWLLVLVLLFPWMLMSMLMRVWVSPMPLSPQLPRWRQ